MIKSTDTAAVVANFEGFDEAAFLTLAYNPSNTQAAIQLAKTLRGEGKRHHLALNFINQAKANSDFMGLHREKYAQPFPSLSDLRPLAPNTVGHQLAKHCDRNQITLDYAGLDTSHYFKELDDVQLYAGFRLFRFHDILHVVTGFDTDPEGEFLIAAFQYAHFKTSFHAMVMAAGILHTTFTKPDELPRLMEDLEKASALGRNAKPLIGLRWEEFMSRDIDELRRELNIIPWQKKAASPGH